MSRPHCKRCRRPMAWTMYGEHFRCPDCDPLPERAVSRETAELTHEILRLLFDEDE